MSKITNSTRDLEASLQAPLPPPSTEHETAAREQVAQLGDNPTTAQMTTLMNQTRQETQQFSQHLLGTMRTVAQHDSDLT
jgi:hypothetical protein